MLGMQATSCSMEAICFGAIAEEALEREPISHEVIYYRSTSKYGKYTLEDYL